MPSCFDLDLIDLKTEQKIKNAFCIINTDVKQLIANKNLHLHTEELKYFDALPSLERRKSYLMGRISAKSAIKQIHSHLKSSDIYINNGIFQFPYIEVPSGINLQLSISHSSDVAVALAFAQSHPMAIDIELINPERMQTIKSQATQDELSMVFDLFTDHSSGLTLLWTAKEALSKVLRCGLLVDFTLLEINSISKLGDQFWIKYKNFSQYQALTFQHDVTICSLVYPTNTTLNFVTNIMENLRNI